MKYQDYLDEYIKKGSFLKILNKKDIFFLIVQVLF